MKRTTGWIAVLAVTLVAYAGLRANQEVQAGEGNGDGMQGAAAERILKESRGRFNKHGWNHYGPGYFTLDRETGVLESHGGMGLLWYSERAFADFILELEFQCVSEATNSGIFYRVPEIPVSDDYIYHSFEIQIHDAGDDIHMTGAVYDAEAPTKRASKPVGEWNRFKITVIEDRVQIELNGEQIVDWQMEPRGKIRDFASEGYIGLQNHDDQSPVYFRNIFVTELPKKG
jgi:hypothetical protein